ncbi:MAG: aspartyl protease family protein [Balneolaceae bacterium]
MIFKFRNLPKLAGLILVIVLVNSCNYVKNIKLLTGGSVERSNFVETIPFEYKKDIIVIEALVNDQDEKRHFILDTGAFESKIEIGLAEKLNLPTKAKKRNSTAQGITKTIEVTRLGKLYLGKTEFSNISAGKLSYDEYSASKCIAQDGIIGANLMKLAHWRIDYKLQEIQFSDRPLDYTKEESHVLDFDRPLLSGTPEIEIKVAGKTISGILFDIGYNGGLVLPARFSDSFPSLDEKKYYDRSTSGIFGTNTDTLISKNLDISLGGYKANLPIGFSAIGKALLGNDILEHFIVSIDYDRNKIILQPQSEVYVEQPYSFIPGILNDSLWVVTRTTSDLTFSLGDTLQSINGNKPVNLYSSFCDYSLNIRKLLNGDSLLVTKINGSSIKLDIRN